MLRRRYPVALQSSLFLTVNTHALVRVSFGSSRPVVHALCWAEVVSVRLAVNAADAGRGETPIGDSSEKRKPHGCEGAWDLGPGLYGIYILTSENTSTGRLGE